MEARRRVRFFDSGNASSEQENKAVLVRDTHMRNWRCALAINQAYAGNCDGIDALKISTSSMPHVDDLPDIIDAINQAIPGVQHKIYIVDLREESHGYLNGEPVTLATDHNWINRGKFEIQALEEEYKWIHGFNVNDEFKVISPLEHKKIIAGDALVLSGNESAFIQIKSSSTEKEVIESIGLTYRRFMVSDHLAPRPEVVNDFIAFYNSLPADAWLHMHCRGGNGRSTTFLTMVDMLNNADKLSCEEIILRQSVLSPNYNLAQIVREVPELTPGYRERYVFLRKFYDYALSLKNGNKQFWSHWCESQQSAQLNLNR